MPGLCVKGAGHLHTTDIRKIFTDGPSIKDEIERHPGWAAAGGKEHEDVCV